VTATPNPSAPSNVTVDNIKNTNRAGSKAISCQNGCNLLDGCFVAGTLVHLPSGKKPIEEIQAGEKIYTFDETSGQWVISTVEEPLTRTGKEFVRLYTATDTILSTSNHPYYLPARQNYVEAIALRKGMILHTISGKPLVVDSVAVLNMELLVYNLEVAVHHNFFVGNSGVLVHNDCRVTAAGVKNSDLEAVFPASSLDQIKTQLGERLGTLMPNGDINSQTIDLNQFFRFNAPTGETARAAFIQDRLRTWKRLEDAGKKVMFTDRNKLEQFHQLSEPNQLLYAKLNEASNGKDGGTIFKFLNDVENTPGFKATLNKVENEILNRVLVRYKNGVTATAGEVDFAQTTINVLPPGTLKDRIDHWFSIAKQKDDFVNVKSQNATNLQNDVDTRLLVNNITELQPFINAGYNKSRAVQLYQSQGVGIWCTPDQLLWKPVYKANGQLNYLQGIINDAKLTSNAPWTPNQKEIFITPFVNDPDLKEIEVWIKTEGIGDGFDVLEDFITQKVIIKRQDIWKSIGDISGNGDYSQTVKQFEQ